MLDHGVQPSCPLGCVGGEPHTSLQCARAATRPIVVCGVKGDAAQITLECSKGLDFVMCMASHPTYMTYVVITFRDSDAWMGSPFYVKTGVCIPPGLETHTLVPCTMSTVFVEDAHVHKPGELPLDLSASTAVVISHTPCLKDGMPAGPFIGLSASTWKTIYQSTCARRRYACLLWGHTARRPVPRGVTPVQCLVGAPPIRTGLGVQAEPPLYTDCNGTITCLWCQRAFAGKQAFRESCAPECCN